MEIREGRKKEGKMRKKMDRKGGTVVWKGRRGRGGKQKGLRGIRKGKGKHMRYVGMSGLERGRREG
jgi:hypothetical protein